MPRLIGTVNRLIPTVSHEITYGGGGGGGGGAPPHCRLSWSFPSTVNFQVNCSLYNNAGADPEV